MSYSELRFFECNEVIGYYQDSGAPHYHCYVCAGCLKEDEDDSDEWD